MKIEIEVSNLDEFQEAMDAGVDVIMLDNMACEDMAKAAGIAKGTRILLEASGNVTLDRVRKVVAVDAAWVRQVRKGITVVVESVLALGWYDCAHYFER